MVGGLASSFALELLVYPAVVRENPVQPEIIRLFRAR